MWYVALVLSSLLTYFEPGASTIEFPGRMPSPFAPVPHDLARRAAKIVARDLEAQGSSFQHDFSQTGQGKMFGVLVVASADKRVGFLRAVSGMLGGSWRVDGFVPPVFDLDDREEFWPQGQDALAELELRLQNHLHSEEANRLSAEQAAMEADHEARSRELQKRHEEQRASRAQVRQGLQSGTESEAGQRILRELAEQSRANRREAKVFRKELRGERALIEKSLQQAEEQRLVLKRERRELSNSLLRKIQDGYALMNGRSEVLNLRAVFAPLEPPGGSADCAAPKLLVHAHRQGLRPLALAEFWWGAPPLGGGRHSEHFYPPCKSKCGPLLPFLLSGVEHEEAPIYATESVSPEQPTPVFEDESMVVVDKPSGMLSVPGAQARLQDSALTRLRERYPQIEGPGLVHRLDLDTSGLLVMAKSLDVYRSLQAQFAKRQIEKRYVAWLDGTVTRDEGEICLALRVDLEDRPRQIHDPVHGKDAITRFVVLERRDTAEGCFTKVEFQPKSGRTHQLRVHAAHQLGLGAPIVGDRLYGKGHGRLLLHAERLRFSHPQSGKMVDFHSPLPESVAEPDFSAIHLKI